MWAGRYWYGIKPEDKCILIIGGSLIFLNGFAKTAEIIKRRFKDFLLGYKRYYSYNISIDFLQQVADEIMNFCPRYIVGRSVFIDALARANQYRKNEFRKLDLKAVIVTSECLPFEDSQEMISNILSTPVCMEYGSNETDVIAYTNSDGDYRVFWRNQLVEVEDNNNILITSLYNRCIPLIRYKLGDKIVLPKDSEQVRFGIHKISDVDGRQMTTIITKDNVRIHSTVFDNILKFISDVVGYQIVYTKDEIVINLITPDHIEFNSIKSEIRMKLINVHPDLGSIEIKRVDNLYQTNSEKSPANFFLDGYKEQIYLA